MKADERVEKKIIGKVKLKNTEERTQILNTLG